MQYKDFLHRKRILALISNPKYHAIRFSAFEAGYVHSLSSFAQTVASSAGRNYQRIAGSADQLSLLFHPDVKSSGEFECRVAVGLRKIWLNA
jgi:hypothetical protein